MRTLVTLSAAALVVCGASALAQEPDVTFGSPSTGTVPVQSVPSGYYAPDVPMPPRVLQNQESKHPHPPLPVGPSNNLPNPPTPETQPVDPEIIDAGQFRFFQNTLVNPTGNRSPRTPEPASATLRDTVIQTGNWHAGISPDNGETWTNVSPYTFFPSVDGGFCCDQQAIDVQTHNFAMWMLQYSRGSNGNNRLRFAIANSRDKLRSASASDWYYYDLSAQFFGYAAGDWLDYEDVAFDSTWLYCRTNVIGPGESIVFRLRLDDLQTRVGARVEWYTSATLGGWSHRLAKGSGSAGLMAFASIRNTSSVYVYTWPTSPGSTVSRSTRSVASFVDSGASAPGPDGRDWAGFWNATGQMQGAYGTSSECGFSWGCSATSGRPYAYTRVARFRLSDRTLIAETDIWNSSGAFLYNDMMSNSVGDVGGVVAYGGSTTYVATYNYIIDSYDPWPPANAYRQQAGSSGPNVNRFGDYFTVRRHPISSRTWISNGSSCPDPNTGNHRFVWFGRDDNEPTWVNLTVQTNGPSSASITMDVTDLDGRKNGATTFTRRFAPQQGYALTAPASVSSGGNVWIFERWRYQVQPGASFNNAPAGERTLELSTCGSLDDTCIADYRLRRTLSIQSTNPTSGVSITVSPSDLNGRTNGTTTFTRYYMDGQSVSLTAPSSVGFNPFRYWTVNGVIQRTGRVISVSMNGAKTAVAIYWNNIAGSVRSIGAGCVGSTGRVPSHTITWPSGQQGPQQGSPTTYALSGARATAGVALNVGLSTRTFNGLRLPLDLGIIGVTGCTLYHDIVSSQSLVTNRSGVASFPINWPVDPSAVGSRVYSSWIIVDPGVRRPLPLTLSNAMETVLGGNR